MVATGTRVRFRTARGRRGLETEPAIRRISCSSICLRSARLTQPQMFLNFAYLAFYFAASPPSLVPVGLKLFGFG